MDLSQHLEKPGRESRAFFGSLCNRRRLGCLRHRLNGSQWLGPASESGRILQMLQLGHRLRLCDNARLNELASSYRQDHVAVGGLRIDHNFSGIGRVDRDDRRCDNAQINDLAPLMVKTTSRSEAFGLITISPALAAPTVTSSAATTAANNFIGHSLGFKGHRAQRAKSTIGYS